MSIAFLLSNAIHPCRRLMLVEKWPEASSQRAQDGLLHGADVVGVYEVGGYQQCQNSSQLLSTWDINICKNLPSFFLSLRQSAYSQSTLALLLATCLELTLRPSEHPGCRPHLLFHVCFHSVFYFPIPRTGLRKP